MATSVNDRVITLMKNNLSAEQMVGALECLHQGADQDNTPTNRKNAKRNLEELLNQLEGAFANWRPGFILNSLKKQKAYNANLRAAFAAYDRAHPAPQAQPGNANNPDIAAGGAPQQQNNQPQAGNTANNNPNNGGNNNNGNNNNGNGNNNVAPAVTNNYMDGSNTHNYLDGSNVTNVSVTTQKGGTSNINIPGSKDGDVTVDGEEIRSGK